MSHRNGRNSRNSFAEGAKISVLSVLSVGQKYSFVEKPAAQYNKSPTEMTEMTERLRRVRVTRFPLFPLFPWDNKNFPHEILIVPQKQQKQQKAFHAPLNRSLRINGACSLCLPSFATRFACKVSLRALLAKFRYALGLPSFATRFACKELPL